MRMLLSQNYNIEALIIRNRETKSRSANRTAVLDLAAEHSLKILRIDNPNSLKDAVASLKSRAAVLASFGLLLHKEILGHFPLGIINVHPSLLPAHRGPTPIENAILKGDLRTGITLMKISENLDAGDIYAQSELNIGKDENKLSLTRRLGVLAAGILAENLPLILKQQLRPKPQDHQQATYTPTIKSGRTLDFEQHPANYFERHIRAFEGCPNNKFKLNQKTVEIKSAGAFKLANCRQPVFYDKQKKLIYVRCQRDYLAVALLQPADRNVMSAADFVNGFYRELL